MEWSLLTVYLGCAAAGGTILVVQTILLLFGGGHHDGDADLGHVDSGIGASDSGEVHTQDAAFGLFSVRAIAAFLAIFGLAGWAGLSAGWSQWMTALVAFGAGLVMMVAVAWLFHAQRKLASQGNVEPGRAVSMTARVYLRIPENNTGKGKITVALQGRTVELNAFTKGAMIPTDAEVRVVRQVTPDTFEVESI